MEDLGDMSRDDMKDKIKNVHLLVFDYVQAVSSKYIFFLMGIRGDFGNE